MRTTLVLDDELVREARHRAIERGVTLSRMVNEALRESLDRPKGQVSRLTLVTYGGSSRASRHEPTDLKVVLEDEDHERSG